MTNPPLPDWLKTEEELRALAHFKDTRKLHPMTIPLIMGAVALSLVILAL